MTPAQQGRSRWRRRRQLQPRPSRPSASRPSWLRRLLAQLRRRPARAGAGWCQPSRAAWWARPPSRPSASRPRPSSRRLRMGPASLSSPSRWVMSWAVGARLGLHCTSTLAACLPHYFARPMHCLRVTSCLQVSYAPPASELSRDGCGGSGNVRRITPVPLSATSPLPEVADSRPPAGGKPGGAAGGPTTFNIAALAMAAGQQAAKQQGKGDAGEN